MAGARQTATGLVPSRQQYLDLKRQHPDSILLYRMGDFYEAFDDDAEIVARDARVTLTSRSFGRNGRVPMAGIPYHALNHYLGRLLAAGHTVAIAEQLSEPGRGLVERAVTRVVTPGTVADAALLPESENRYLAAVARAGDALGLAWVDVSTGEFGAMQFSGESAAERLDEELARLCPSECLIPDDGHAAAPGAGHQTRLEHWHFEPERARVALCRQFGTPTLSPFGCDDLPGAIGAAGAILAYLRRTNPSLLPLLKGLRTERASGYVGLDPATRRNLELTRSLRTGGRRGSLVSVLDQTRTAMGARALHRLVGQPLRDLKELERRQGIVEALVERSALRAVLGQALAEVGDLERLTSRVTQGLAGARDFLMVGAALRRLPMVEECLRKSGARSLDEFADELDLCGDVLALIDSAVEDDGEGGGRIRRGFSAALDAAVDGARDTKRWLASLERRERERTGIRSLKVGFNRVFGYYIEVTRSNLGLVPSDYVRKQTVANGERYFTAELKEAEARILAADERIAALERDALARLSMEVTAASARLIHTAGRLAFLDALLSLAEVAARSRWVKPVLDDSDTLVVSGGRHPVVEASLGGEPFIPNDCRLGGDHERVLVVTGPNMGGKSTYLRQVALIVLLAQIGSFVPADAAHIGLVDRIFTRVGAHDDLPGGASTFMVEMLETAGILHNATDRSLIVLDEVGRGTSADDGFAIACAVLEDIHSRIRARTLFATHYLELAEQAARLPGARNVHVAAIEADDRVVFLYSLREGAADRAYGIQVARLAGLPEWVADRAEAILRERAVAGAAGADPAGVVIPRAVREEFCRGWTEPPYQLSLAGFPSLEDRAGRLARDLESLDLQGMTPREAIDWLFEQQARLRGGS